MNVDCTLGRDPDQRTWNTIWACWTAGTLGTLLAAEIVAIRSGGRGSCTLTAVTRRVAGLDPRKPYHPARQMAVCALAALFVRHLITGR